jgi:hypothetical protein
VGGGPDRRAPAGSEWEREEGKLGRAGFVGRKRRWAGLAGRLDRFVFFFSFFSNPFQTKSSNLLNQFFTQIFTIFFTIILRTFSQIL